MSSSTIANITGDSYAIGCWFEDSEWWPWWTAEEDKIIVEAMPAWRVVESFFPGVSYRLQHMTMIDRVQPALVLNLATKVSAPRADMFELSGHAANLFVQCGSSQTLLTHFLLATKPRHYSLLSNTEQAEQGWHPGRSEVLYKEGWREWCSLNKRKGYFKDIPIAHKAQLIADVNQIGVIAQSFSGYQSELLGGRVFNTGTFNLSEMSSWETSSCPYWPNVRVRTSMRSEDREYGNKYPPFMRHIAERHYYAMQEHPRRHRIISDKAGETLESFLSNYRKLMGDVFYSMTAAGYTQPEVMEVQLDICQRFCGLPLEKLHAEYRKVWRVAVGNKKVVVRLIAKESLLSDFICAIEC